MKRRFSKKFKTISEWRTDRSRLTRYAITIERKHELDKSLSLCELQIVKFSDLDQSRKPWSELTAKERTDRVDSLRVINQMRRKGLSLTEASKREGVDRRLVKKHVASALEKKKGTWRAKASDKIQRGMEIFTRGEKKVIVVDSLKEASTIGRYHSTVRWDLLTRGNPDALINFLPAKIHDAEGRAYTLERNPKKVRELDEQIDEIEFYDIYNVNP
ncbi:MAG: hypothetical protein ABIC95_06015 [archaeon]